MIIAIDMSEVRLVIRLERHIPAGERPARGGEDELDAEQGGEDDAGFP